MAHFFRSNFFLVVLVSCAVCITLYWHWPISIMPTSLSTPADTVVAADISASSILKSPLPARAKTDRRTGIPGLQDTQVDGELKADSAGNLQLNSALRDYLDYFLSAADEAGIERVVDVMLADARGRLSEPALSQFIAILSDYLSYKNASLAMLQQPLSDAQKNNSDGTVAALRQGLQQLTQLRRAYFSAEAAEALFGAEEAYGLYTLENMEIISRNDLSNDEKIRSQEYLRAQLPEGMRASEERQAKAYDLSVQTEKLWQVHSSEAQVRELLSSSYDSPTVERLLIEYRNEQAWQKNYALYQQELKKLEASGLSNLDWKNEEQRLRQRLFSTKDLYRVSVYDDINATLSGESNGK